MNGTPHVLIIDDNLDDLAVYARWLRTGRPNEFEVSTASSFEAAVESGAVTTCDCIVLDYDLRDSTCLDVMTDLAAREIAVPIVAVTGNGSEQIAVDVMRGGASDYLIKSRMAPADLREAVTRQLAKAALRRAERERDRLIERVTIATKAAKVGIWEWHIATDDVVWDPMMFALHGLSQAARSPTCAAWMRLLHPDDREATERRLSQSAAGGAPFETEYRVVWPSGDVHIIQAMAHVIGDASGNAVRMIGTNQNVTEVRTLAGKLRLETQRLLEANQLAEETTRAKSDFLANMSHEIRTPMNGIIGLTSLLSDGALTVDQRRCVSLLADAGRSLLAIINDVLDLSKVEAGRIDLESIPLSTSGLLDGAVSIVRGEANAKGLELGIVIAPDVPAWVSGDPTRLRQILLNLLTNAIKFTPAGRVDVAVARLPGNPPYLRFEVRDTGIGIAPDRQGRLFQTFSQVDRSIARQYGGTGLGLAISKRLAEAMSGTMGVASSPAAGSVFWFTAQLPAAALPSAAPHAVDSVRSPARRILVADDNATNQIVVDGMLRHDGHTTVLTGDGAAAVAAARASHFDLILMDMQMPVMDGLEATRRIRALPLAAGRVPIVALTANAMPDEVAKCLAAGMDGHLAKPIDRAHLRRIVATWTADRATPPEELDPARRATAAAAASAAPTGPLAHLDLALLRTRLEGDDELISLLLRAASESIATGMQRIADALAEHERRAVIQAAHYLKGTFVQLQAVRLIDLADQIEHQTEATFWIEGPPLLAALHGALRALVDEIAAYLVALPAAPIGEATYHAR